MRSLPAMAIIAEQVNLATAAITSTRIGIEQVDQTKDRSLDQEFCHYSVAMRLHMLHNAPSHYSLTRSSEVGLPAAARAGHARRPVPCSAVTRRSASSMLLDWD